MDALGLLRLVAGALVMFVAPGLAWSLALKPRLARDVPALAFWSVAASAALLVLYGTALGLAGLFTAPWLVGVALVVASLGALAAWRRTPEVGKDVDPSEDFRARVEALRARKVAAVMLRKGGKRAEADEEDAEAARLEATARKTLYGR